MRETQPAVYPGLRLLAALLAGATLLHHGAAAAQDCPAARSAKQGFVLERNTNRMEVVFSEDRIVRTISRSSDGQTWLETTQFEGLFDLERLERGRRTVYRPKTDLARLFPLKVGGEMKADFDVEGAERQKTQSVTLTVKRSDTLYIGACKYEVFVIERRSTSRQYQQTDYYAPALRVVIGKEFNNRGTLNKYDRIRGPGRRSMRPFPIARNEARARPTPGLALACVARASMGLDPGYEA